MFLKVMHLLVELTVQTKTRGLSQRAKRLKQQLNCGLQLVFLPPFPLPA